MTSRIVVKIGSASLTTEEGGLDRRAISFFADEIASLSAQGHEVLLVTSGAVAAGFREIDTRAVPNRYMRNKYRRCRSGSADAGISTGFCAAPRYYGTNPINSY